MDLIWIIYSLFSLHTVSAWEAFTKQYKEFAPALQDDLYSRSPGPSLPPDAKMLSGPAASVLSPGLLGNIVSYLPEATRIAHLHMNDMFDREAGMSRHLATQGFGGRSGGFKFVQSFNGGTPHGKQMSYSAFLQSSMLSHIRLRFDLSNVQVLALMASLPPVLGINQVTYQPNTVLPQSPPDVCPYPAFVACNPGAVYRTYDGSCNNLQYPIRGMSMTPLGRFIPPQYADAISVPRVSVTGGPLPSARLVSTTIHWDIDLPHHTHTHMLMQFGQFIDHDLSRTAITKLTDHPSGFSDKVEDVECGDDGCQTHGMENQACLPIPVHRNDSFFGHKRCLMFVRSQEVPYAPHCRLGPREQLNQLTSWLDASHVYGSTLKEHTKLRDHTNNRRGWFVMSRHPAGRYQPLLPKDPDFKDCMNPGPVIQCFRAGEGRVNEFLGLTSMHTIFSREHNRIEAGLHSLNSHWGGEKLFQETRRILTAKWQFMIYNEFLPVILGKGAMDHQGLTVHQHGYFDGYNPQVDPSVGNSFATAAFRFGHSLINGMVDMKGPDYHTYTKVPLSTLIRTPHMLYNRPDQGVDSLLRGLLGQHAQTRDSFIVKELTTQLFTENAPNGLGEDLMSLNVQRGREHGLPGYNVFRQWCGLPRAHHWIDLSQELPGPVLERLTRLYHHVDDIDLFTGGISEASLPGAVIGPTFSCIIARQFANAKFGDRFWFENNVDNPHPFTLPQLQEIRKSTLARMICVNSDGITHIQPRAMLQPLPEVFATLRRSGQLGRMGNFVEHYFGTENLRVPCHSLHDTDLSHWKDISSPQFNPPSPHFETAHFNPQITHEHHHFNPPPPPDIPHGFNPPQPPEIPHFNPPPHPFGNGPPPFTITIE